MNSSDAAHQQILQSAFLEMSYLLLLVFCHSHENELRLFKSALKASMRLIRAASRLS
jgi:hypothetical protein